MTLYLVRHGRALAGIEETDPGLDDVGKSQAEHVATALQSVKAKRLVCSPLRRARETAAPIAEALGLTLEIRPEITEVFDPNMTPEARTAMLGTFLSGVWSAQPARLKAWRERVLGTLIELGDQPTIIVSHFVAICVAIGESTQDDRVSPCALANASITTLIVDKGRLVLKRPGEVAHLSRDEITARHSVIPGRP